MAATTRDKELEHYKSEVERLNKLVEMLRKENSEQSVEIEFLRTELASVRQGGRLYSDNPDSAEHMRQIVKKRDEALEEAREKFMRDFPNAGPLDMLTVSNQEGLDEIDSLPEGSNRDPKLLNNSGGKV